MDIVRLIRFGLVGLVGVGLNAAILFILIDGAGWPLMASALASAIAVGLYNYFFNNAWSFKDRQHSGVEHVTGLSKHMTVLAVYHAFYFSILYLLSHTSIHYTINSVIAVGISFIPRYILSYVWVWKEKAHA